MMDTENNKTQAEWILDRIEAELKKWTDHSIRGMKSGNVSYFQGKIALIADLQTRIYEIRQEMKESDVNPEYLRGDKVIHGGKTAEVVDTYANGALLIRIGRNTFKTVLPGEVQLCGPDGNEPRGPEVRFG